MSILCGNCKQHHQSVAEVRACYGTQRAFVSTAAPTANTILGRLASQGTRNDAAVARTRPVTAPPAPVRTDSWSAQRAGAATDAQIGFILKLAAERESTPEDAVVEGMSKRDAGFRINRLKGLPYRSQGIPATSFITNSPARTLMSAPTVQQDGMYRNPVTGEIFKVQYNRAQGSGMRLYAKRLVLNIDGHEISNPTPEWAGRWSKDRDSARFHYAPGAIRTIRPEWLMTLAEAREFGALYGTCVRCGRTLTAEDSIDRMMGKVCAGKGSWK